MKYKKYDCNSYNIHTIKTDKFKTVRMEIVFTRELKKDEMPSFSFLSDLLTDCSKYYTRRKDIAIRLEELYKAAFYGSTNKIGNMLMTSFVIDFIDPLYINEANYLEDVLSLPFDIICNPKVINDEFDLTNFNIVKRRMLENIENIKESSDRLAIINALTSMDSESPSSYRLMGTKEDLEKITPSSLYEIYKKLLYSSNCDIFLVGNIDMDNTVKIIKKKFKNHVIKLTYPKLVIQNKTRKKALTLSEPSNFIQSTLVMIYNINKLDKYTKDIVFHVFNYIFGSGGITSKLYQKLRNENSLCYGVRSIYLKYDELLLIEVSLDKKNVSLAEKLIKNCVKEMVNNNFTDEMLEDAKKNLLFSLKMNRDSNVTILNNYLFHVFDNLPLIEEREELIRNVSRSDVLLCSKSLSLNTVYVLEAKDDGGDGKNEGN